MTSGMAVRAHRFGDWSMASHVERADAKSANAPRPPQRASAEVRALDMAAGSPVGNRLPDPTHRRLQAGGAGLSPLVC